MKKAVILFLAAAVLVGCPKNQDVPPPSREDELTVKLADVEEGYRTVLSCLGKVRSYGSRGQRFQDNSYLVATLLKNESSETFYFKVSKKSVYLSRRGETHVSGNEIFGSRAVRDDLSGLVRIRALRSGDELATFRPEAQTLRITAELRGSSDRIVTINCRTREVSVTRY